MVKSKGLFFIMVAASLWSCSPTITDFDVERDVNRYFLKDVLPLDANVGDVQVFMTTFHEQLVEDDNLIELTLRSENSTRERVEYEIVKQYFREVYLFRWVTDPVETEKGAHYVYFSAKFKWGADPVTHKPKKICIGFGPSYYGKSELVSNHRVIRFNKTLKPRPAKDGDKRHYLREKRPADSLSFVVNPNEFNATAFNVSKVVYYSYNKIGGMKSLVYDVPFVLGDEEALKFVSVRKF